MAQNITLLGASYTAVPAVTLPKTGGGTAQFDDTTDANATAADILTGKTAYVNGVKLTGTGSGGGGPSYTLTTIAPQQTVVSTSPPADDTDMLPLTSSEGLVEGDYYLVTVNGAVRAQTAVRNNYVLYLADITDAWWDGNRMVIMASNTLYFCPWAAGTYTVKVEHLELDSGGGGGSTLIEKAITANGTYNASDDSADGYSKVTVNVSSGSSKNTQTVQSTSRRNNTALGSITSLTCSKAGTYDVYWTVTRSNTSQTWGSQLYINGTAYGTENTTWTNNVQNNHLTDVTIPANAAVAVYGRSRSGYYIYAPQLTIVEA